MIGAGMAGLAAARRLHAAGAEVTLLERASRPGGRAGHAGRESWWFDSGAHAVSSADSALLGFVGEAGLAAQALPLRPLLLAQMHRGRAAPVSPRDWSGAARIPGLRWRDALRLVRLERLLSRFDAILDPHAPERGARLDDRSAADFARLYFGASALSHWAAPLLAETCGGDPAEASRLLLMGLLRQRRWATPGSLRVGLGRLVEAAAEPLDVRLGSEVEAIEERGGRLEVRLAGGDPLDAEAVVVATRADAARRIAAPLLVSAEDDHLAGVAYAPAVVLHAALSRSLAGVATRLRFPAGSGWPLASATLECGVPESPELPPARVPGRAGAVSLVASPAWSRARLDAPDESLEKELLPSLDRLNPSASGWLEFTRVERHREAWPRFDVGHGRALARLRGVLADRRAAGRRLYLAGDHLALPTLDGAVASGRRAADEALADLGVTPRGAPR